MKSYPSLPYGTECHLPIFAFDKLDGSNVRAEWTKKKGFYKFGTRNRLVDGSDAVFGRIPSLVVGKYEKTLGNALTIQGYDRAVCFFELHGPKSFAGMHDPGDDLTVTLFDVAPHRHGILDPEAFMNLCDYNDVDRVTALYIGQCTPEFIESVRDGSLPGMTFEGVVCKTKNDKKTKQPIMFKQKSRAWLDKLGTYCADNKALFNSLI